MDPYDSGLQCARRKDHEDDQCVFGGIAWKRGTPRYVRPEEKIELVRKVVEARDNGDFSPILPKLREILDLPS